MGKKKIKGSGKKMRFSRLFIVIATLVILGIGYWFFSQKQVRQMNQTPQMQIAMRIGAEI